MSVESVNQIQVFAQLSQVSAQKVEEQEKKKKEALAKEKRLATQKEVLNEIDTDLGKKFSQKDPTPKLPDYTHLKAKRGSHEEPWADGHKVNIER